MKKKFRALSVSLASVAVACFAAVFLGVAGLTFMFNLAAGGSDKEIGGGAVNAAVTGPIHDWSTSGNEGTSEDPYVINNAAEFKSMLVDGTNSPSQGNNTAGNYYVLMSNIDLSEYYPWVPIGNSTANSFKGNFDGNGCTISGIKQGNLNSPVNSMVGLFGYVESHTLTSGFVTTIKNFTLTNIDLSTTISSGPQAAAGVAAYVFGATTHRASNAEVLFENIGIKKTDDYRDVKPYNTFAEPFDDLTKYAAYNSAINALGGSNNEGVTDTGNRIKGYAAGGILGLAGNYANVSIKGCYNEIMVESTSFFSGGISGYSDSGSKITVEESYNIGTIIGGGNSYTGGIHGLIERNSEVVIRNCYNLANIYGGDDAGGIFGTCWSNTGNMATLEKCFSVGNIYGSPSSTSGVSSVYKGGIMGYLGGGTVNVSDCYFVGIVSNGNTTGLGQTSSGGTRTDYGQVSIEELYSEEFLTEHFSADGDSAFVLLYDIEGNPYVTLRRFNYAGTVVLDGNGGFFKGILNNIKVDDEMDEDGFTNGIDILNGYIYLTFAEGVNLDLNTVDLDGDSNADPIEGVAFRAYIGEIITQEILNELNIDGWIAGDSEQFNIPVGIAGGEDTINDNLEYTGQVFEGWSKESGDEQGMTVYGRNNDFIAEAVADTNLFAFYAKWRNSMAYQLDADNSHVPVDDRVSVEVLIYYNGGNIVPKGEYFVQGDTNKIGARPTQPPQAGYRYQFVNFYVYNPTDDGSGEIGYQIFGTPYLANAATNLYMIDLGQPADLVYGSLGTEINGSFVTTYITGTGTDAKLRIFAEFIQVKQSTFTVSAESGREDRGSAAKQINDGAFEDISWGSEVTYDTEGTGAATSVKIRAAAETYYNFVGFRLDGELIAVGDDLTDVGGIDLAAVGFGFDGNNLIVGLEYMDGKELVLVFDSIKYAVVFVAATETVTETGGVVSREINPIGDGAPTIEGTESLEVGIGGSITDVSANVVDGWRRADKFNNLRIENQQDAGTYDMLNTRQDGTVAINDIGASFLEKYLDNDTITIYVIYVKQYSLTVTIDDTSADSKSGQVSFKDYNKNTWTVNESVLSKTLWFDEGDIVRLEILPKSNDYQIFSIDTLEGEEALTNGRVNVVIGNEDRTIEVAFQLKSVDIEVRALYVEEGTQKEIVAGDFVDGHSYVTADSLEEVLSGSSVGITHGTAEGYSFVGWKKLVNGELISIAGTNAGTSELEYIVSVADVSGFTNSIVIVMEFKKQYALNIMIKGKYEGVADNNELYEYKVFVGGHEVPGVALEEVAQDSVVDIIITTPKYYVLDPIVDAKANEPLVDNKDGTHTLSVTIDGLRDINISFSEMVYEISHEDNLNGANGSLNFSSDEVKIGDKIILSFVADSGYDFDSWQIDGKKITEILDKDNKPLATVSGDGKTVTFEVNSAFLDTLVGADNKVSLNSTVSTTINKGFLAGILVGAVLVPLLIIGAVVLAVLNGKKKKEYAIALQKHKESSARLGQADVIKKLLKDNDDSNQGN